MRKIFYFIFRLLKTIIKIILYYGSLMLLGSLICYGTMYSDLFRISKAFNDGINLDIDIILSKLIKIINKYKINSKDKNIVEDCNKTITLVHIFQEKYLTNRSTLSKIKGIFQLYNYFKLFKIPFIIYKILNIFWYIYGIYLIYLITRHIYNKYKNYKSK